MKEDRYRPFQLKILAATFLAYAGYYLCRRPFYVVKSDLADAFNFTTVDLANLGTAYLVAYMLGQFSSAFFGRKLGAKMLLIAGMAVSIACAAAFGFSNSFWTFMLFLSLNGLAQGTGWPGCIGSLAFWFRRTQRGSVLGLWSTCYQVGPVAATALASFLLGMSGWRSAFFGGSIGLLAIWFLVLMLHPGTPEDAGLDPLADEDGPGQRPSFAEGRSAGWSKRLVLTIIMMGTIYFCIKFLRYALWSWLPYFLKVNFSLDADNAGYLSTVFDLCGFAGVVASGFISDKIFRGRRAFLCFLMLLLMTVSFIIMYSSGSSNLGLFVASIGSAGFMLFGPDALLSGVGAIDVASKHRALAAAGIINGMGSVGPIFQEQLIGWMYRIYQGNILPVLIMLVIIAGTSTLLMLALWLRAMRGKADL